MHTGVAVWNYRGKSFLDNVEHFASAGFRAVSAVGGSFLKQDDATLDRLAGLLRAHGLPFTLHHKLPDAEDPAAAERFPSEVDFVLRWHARHGLLTGLTFDVKGEPDFWLPSLRRVLERFEGTSVFVACEDFPRNDEQLRRLDGLDERFASLGILVDLGHMNLRIAGEAEDREAAAEGYLRAIRLPIRELHVHDNDGQADQHNALGRGTLPLDAAARTLRAARFDGIATIEFVPQWNGIADDEGYALAEDCRRRWEAAIAQAPASERE